VCARAPLQRQIDVSDYIIIVLSKEAARSAWVAEELEYAVNLEFKARDVAIIPVLLDNYRIPNYLQEYQTINLRYGFERGVQELLDRITLIPEIDFSILDTKAFENLIADLMRSLGFRNLERDYRSYDQRFDIRCSYQHKDPFGSITTERWLVEVKFYRDSRIDLRTLMRARARIDNGIHC